MTVVETLDRAFKVVSALLGVEIKPKEDDEILINAIIDGMDWAQSKLKELYDDKLPDTEWWRLFGVYLAFGMLVMEPPTHKVPNDVVEPTYEIPENIKDLIVKLVQDKLILDLSQHLFEYVGCVITTRSRKCFETNP
jgi:hypothetical protein